MKHITACFSQEMLKICEQSYQDDRWQEVIFDFLGHPLNQHVQLAQLNEGKLVLITDSAIWANQLKMQLPQLRDYLRIKHHCYQLKFIQVKMVPDLKLQLG